ncbi:AAA family ATPase [Nocardia asiatica]|uniref:AAA family ATPase n=1 Tax=Nocardia asiatica TaxID=209252 RepID=UPI002458FA48|nr:AAA family ATPase [Nocardia asiatica]
MIDRHGGRGPAYTALANTFLGRVPELARIEALLADRTELITLTGSGGIGKTHLALEAVRQLGSDPGIQVFWVTLARLSGASDSAAVEREIASAVCGAVSSDRRLFQAITDILSGLASTGSHPILVLDNCEHVLPAAIEQVAALTDAVPGLSILATSQERLGLPDEALVTVPPLTSSESLALLRYHAERVGRTIGDADAAETICKKVDHHPLHIRLAAARLRHHPPAHVLRELTGDHNDSRLRWTTGVRTGIDPRHTDMGNAIAWSYDLAEPKEQLLLQRLSIFASGHDGSVLDHPTGPHHGAELDRIVAVCADPTELTAEEIPFLLEQLADRSLISTHFTTATTRYFLLESIRVYARSRCAARHGAPAEMARLAARHRTHHRDELVKAQQSAFGPAEFTFIEWVRSAWPDIAIAVDNSLASGDTDTALTMALSLTTMHAPYILGVTRQIQYWTEEALTRSRAAGRPYTELEVAALTQLAWLMGVQNTQDAADRLADECVRACASDGTAPPWRQQPEIDFGLPAAVEFACGTILLNVHSDPRSISVLNRARRKFEAAKDDFGAYMARSVENIAESMLGSPRRAAQLAGENLRVSAAHGSMNSVTCSDLQLSIALTRLGRPTEALSIGRIVMANRLAIGHQWDVLWGVHMRMWALARILTDARAGDLDDAQRIAMAEDIAHLAGGAETQALSLGYSVVGQGPLRAESDAAIAAARKVLGDADYDAAEKRGRRLRPELFEVQQLALGALRIAAPSPRPSDEGATPWRDLTATEQDIAALAAAGWPNSAIARRRHNSIRTIDTHMTSILRKLRIRSRDEISLHIPADRAHGPLSFTTGESGGRKSESVC